MYQIVPDSLLVLQLSDYWADDFHVTLLHIGIGRNVIFVVSTPILLDSCSFDTPLRDRCDTY